ncbi:hypothetical protein B0H13DRAFT_2284077 [Mycena leptocephala]|nr:hypothetical protein B0H13DRAFT_2284077 [Mycena leptocephala]
MHNNPISKANPGTHYQRRKERSLARRSASAREAWREQSVEDTSSAQTGCEERVEEARWVHASRTGAPDEGRSGRRGVTVKEVVREVRRGAALAMGIVCVVWEDGEPGAACSSESRTTRLRWAQRTGSGGNVAKARNVVIYARGQSAGAGMAMDGVLCVLTQIRGDAGHADRHGRGARRGHGRPDRRRRAFEERYSAARDRMPSSWIEASISQWMEAIGVGQAPALIKKSETPWREGSVVRMLRGSAGASSKTGRPLSKGDILAKKFLKPEA